MTGILTVFFSIILSVSSQNAGVTSPPPFVRKIEREISQQMRKSGLPVLVTHLHRREAYNAMFMERLSLHELSQTAINGVPAAIENAMQLTSEILELLQTLSDERAA